MLRCCLIFSLCLVAIHADGKFTVVSTRSSVDYRGSEPLKSDFVGQVILSATGHDVSNDVTWSGIYILDPFKPPTTTATIYIDGLDSIQLKKTKKSYAILGNNCGDSLLTMVDDIKAENEAILDLNFMDNNAEAISTFREQYGDVEVAAINGTANFNPMLHSVDKEYFEAIAFANALDVYITPEKIKSVQHVLMRFSVKAVLEAHNNDPEVVAAIAKHMGKIVTDLNNALQKVTDNKAMLVVITQKWTEQPESTPNREKRAAEDEPTNLNLAEYYNDDYPVIFNIILWFMVTFGLALLAVSYAIGAMDPGRDSIIYRMTSTRMKKDN